MVNRVLNRYFETMYKFLVIKVHLDFVVVYSYFGRNGLTERFWFGKENGNGKKILFKSGLISRGEGLIVHFELPVKSQFCLSR